VQIFAVPSKISFKIHMIVLEPFHHVVHITVSLLDLLYHAITEDDAYNGHFIVVFWMFVDL